MSAHPDEVGDEAGEKTDKAEKNRQLQVVKRKEHTKDLAAFTIINPVMLSEWLMTSRLTSILPSVDAASGYDDPTIRPCGEWQHAHVFIHYLPPMN